MSTPPSQIILNLEQSINFAKNKPTYVRVHVSLLTVLEVEQEEYRETWTSTTATLVLLRARSKAPIHGTDSLRPA